MIKPDDCRFCCGERVPEDEKFGEGIQTMISTFESLMGRIGYPCDDDPSNYIQLRNGNLLCFQNSSGEYVTLGIRIGYCPLCGRELFEEEEHHDPE